MQAFPILVAHGTALAVYRQTAWLRISKRPKVSLLRIVPCYFHTILSVPPHPSPVSFHCLSPLPARASVIQHARLMLWCPSSRSGERRRLRCVGSRCICFIVFAHPFSPWLLSLLFFPRRSGRGSQSRAPPPAPPRYDVINAIIRCSVYRPEAYALP